MEVLVELSPWIWVSVSLLSIILSFIFMDIDAVWFSVGACFALLCSLFGVHIAIQLSVFIVSTSVLMFTFGRMIKRHLKEKNIPYDSDSLIGKKVLILEPVNEYQKGSGVIDDFVWTVSCQAGVNIEKGNHGIIIGIDDNQLIVTNK